ncbi:hypothetical protein Zmor_008870 [Zophobas morio]|uniref:Cell shape-determining protein MreB n=1 Tax=Zophobas morio TaxID=2755281 RepID=A0AA38LZ47_9CUCU|nr:hypothetical protein Zmor_008870 [Zophobas morio]
MVVDFGTSATRVYIEGSGVVFNEPSIIAYNNKTKNIIGIGEEAKKYVGKLNKFIRVHNLQQNGVITDIKMVITFLAEVFKKYEEIIKKTYVTLSCPQGLTDIERSALIKAVKNLGCFYVDAQDSIKLALYGTGYDIFQPTGRLILDMGAGKISCGLVTSNEVVIEKQLKYGGNYVDQEIVKELRNNHNLAIGEVTAEKVKNTIGSLLKTKKGLDIKIYGYDVATMMPTDADINEDDLREIMKRMIYQVTSLITTVLEGSAADLSEDVIRHGIIVTGNFAKIIGLKVYLEDFFEIPAVIAKNCGTAAMDGGIKYKSQTRADYEFEISKKPKDPFLG